MQRTTGSRRAGRSNKQEFPGVSHYRDRHGTLRWRYRHGTSTVNLGTDYGSPEFLRRYTAAVKGERLTAADLPTGKAPDKQPAPRPGDHTLSRLMDDWYKSSQYTRLGKSTRTNYTRIAESLRDLYGNQIAEELTKGTVMRIMQTKADRPEAANGILRVLRLMFDHAVNVLEWMPHNPAREVKKFAPKSREGYHTWTEAEIDQFFKRWPEGTTADLAMAVMLYTGAARVDAVRLGPADITGTGEQRRLRYHRQKMLTRDGVVVDIPLHPALAKRLDRLTPAPTTFLQTEAGEQRSAAGLGNAMREWCDAAGLPHCTSHGLRKACARRLAEAGATPHEIMAVSGHKTLAEVERYTNKVNRSALADTAMARMK